MIKKTLFFVALVLIAGTAMACMYYPPSYKSIITENLREFFLYHDDKNVHLVIQTHVKAPDGLPERLAWVIPFPVLPTKYEVSDPHVFEELYKLFGSSSSKGGDMVRGGLGGAPSNAMPKSPVLVHATQVIGDYKVHPIEVVSDLDLKNTATVLDSWLTKKGFNSIPFDLQKPYIKKGATFLAIELNPKGTEADVKPLHIIFPKAGSGFSIPLRLTHDTRAFDLRIYTFGFAKSWADKDAFWSKNFGDAYFKMDYPQSYFEWHRENPAITKLLAQSQGHIRFYSINQFNAPGQLRARQLPKDPTFNWESVKAVPKIR